MVGPHSSHWNWTDCFLTGSGFTHNDIQPQSRQTRESKNMEAFQTRCVYSTKNHLEWFHQYVMIKYRIAFLLSPCPQLKGSWQAYYGTLINTFSQYFRSPSLLQWLLETSSITFTNWFHGQLELAYWWNWQPYSPSTELLSEKYDQSVLIFAKCGLTQFWVYQLY